MGGKMWNKNEKRINKIKNRYDETNYRHRLS